MIFTANLIAGWSGFLAGAITGAGMGLCFHRATWLGGYDSFRRRLVRLGHIACFGVGLINILFALSTAATAPSAALNWGSVSLIAGMITMPLTCFLAAWRQPFRHLFFIPVSAIGGGIVSVLVALS